MFAYLFSVTMDKVLFNLRDVSEKCVPQQESVDRPHAVEIIQRRNFQVTEESELKEASVLFGRHMAFRLAMERRAVGSMRRPGLKAGLVGLEALTGRDETLEEVDFMSGQLKGLIGNGAVHEIVESRW